MVGAWFSSLQGGQIAYPNFSLYHATKWGIEGFVAAVAQEVASFGIDFLICRTELRRRPRSRKADANL